MASRPFFIGGFRCCVVVAEGEIEFGVEEALVCGPSCLAYDGGRRGFLLGRRRWAEERLGIIKVHKTEGWQWRARGAWGLLNFGVMSRAEGKLRVKVESLREEEEFNAEVAYTHNDLRNKPKNTGRSACCHRRNI